MTMDDRTLKMQCLQLAASIALEGDDVLKLAKELYEWASA
jgi:hypothetical protein